MKPDFSEAVSAYVFR